MNICEACEQFKNRIKEWNYWSGAIDPLPYIDNVIKPHKHLMFEGRRADGAGAHVHVLHCLKCDQWWELSAWPVFGCLEVLPHLPMKERRQYERFIFPLPVRLESMTTGRNEVLDLITRDISASGTFVTTLTSFPEGTRFILDFTIPRNTIEKLNGVRSMSGYTGSIVRSSPHGMVIQFDKESQIETLKAL